MSDTYFCLACTLFSMLKPLYGSITKTEEVLSYASIQFPMCLHLLFAHLPWRSKLFSEIFIAVVFADTLYLEEKLNLYM